MAIACAVIGMIVVTFLNLTASSVPEALQVTAVKVLVPAANLLVNIVMPVSSEDLAAIDAGKIGLLGHRFRRRGAAHHGERRTGAGAGYFDRQKA